MTRNAELSSGRPGPGAFDFLHGTWRVTNRRIVDRADPACDFWETFDARSTVEPILGGWGHTGRFVPSSRDRVMS